MALSGYNPIVSQGVFVYTIEYFLALKGRKFCHFKNNMHEPGVHYAKGNKQCTDLTCIRNLKKSNSEAESRMIFATG